VTDERLAHSIRRLDRALARVEAASERIAAKPDPELAKLMRRHERLRARTQDAIAAIDRLTGAA
jgi:type IV secretory pathway TrbD component